MSCDKITFDTYKEAIDHINGSSKKMKQSFKTYKCRDCGAFHIATANKHRIGAQKKEKHEKEFFEKKINMEKEKKLLQGKINRTQLRPTSKTYTPASQKVLSKIQAQILKAIIENGNKGK
jgi:hypothetical protein